MLAMWLPNATLIFKEQEQCWYLRFTNFDELRERDLHALTDFVKRSGKSAPVLVDRRVPGAFSFSALRSMDRRLDCFEVVAFVSHDFCTRRTLEMICQVFITCTPARCFSNMSDARSWIERKTIPRRSEVA